MNVAGRFGPRVSRLRLIACASSRRHTSSTVDSNTPGQSIKSAPADGVWYQGVRSGTHDFSRFLIRSTAFGLQCELDLVVNNSGSYNYLITYVSGYGSCPWSF